MPLRRPDWLVLTVILLACGSSSKGGDNPKTEDLCANVTCSASDECHVAGTCDGATGLCRNPAAPDGTACSGGTCSGGACTAATGLCAGIVCDVLDECHPAGTCDPATGACVSEPAPDGTPCTGGICATGVCTAVDGSCTDGAANGTETDVDCGGALCAGCVNGRACLADGDCMSGHCAAGHCATLVTALVADPGPQRAVAPGVHVVLDGTRSRSPTARSRPGHGCRPPDPRYSSPAQPPRLPRSMRRPTRPCSRSPSPSGTAPAPRRRRCRSWCARRTGLRRRPASASSSMRCRTAASTALRR